MKLHELLQGIEVLEQNADPELDAISEFNTTCSMLQIRKF